MIDHKNWIPDELHLMLRLSDIEIDNFQKDVKQWIKTFTNIYRSEDVTPYMHVFAMHIPQFLKELKNQALSLRLFSSSSVEKKNHHHVNIIFPLFFFLKKK